MNKKFLATFLCAVFAASLANAKDGVYVGADVVLSNAKHKYNNKFGLVQSTPAQQGKVDSDAVGLGVTVGYKKSFDQVFLAPEIFYDYLNSSTGDYYKTLAPYQQDHLDLRSRYGVKLNLGYDFSKSFAGYLTYGLANVNYINYLPSGNFSEGKSKLSEIYGFGALFHLNQSWDMKAEFTQQRFNTRYSFDGVGVISKVRLNVIKVGLVYNF